MRPKRQWILPKSFDSCLIDPILLAERARDSAHVAQTRIKKHLARKDTESAARVAAEAAEDALAAACVDPEGARAPPSRGFFGRSQGAQLRITEAAPAVVKTSRPGDFLPTI